MSPAAQLLRFPHGKDKLRVFFGRFHMVLYSVFFWAAKQGKKGQNEGHKGSVFRTKK